MGKSADWVFRTKVIETCNPQTMLEKMRHFIRLGYELGYYNSKRYQHIIRRIDEIGRMTGGWIKEINNRKNMQYGQACVNSNKKLGLTAENTGCATAPPKGGGKG